MANITLWKKVEVTGCDYEDGSDTRKTKVSHFFVHESEEKVAFEMMAEDYGSQDYSYRIDYVRVAKFNENYLDDIKKAIEEYEKTKTVEPSMSEDDAIYEGVN